MSADLSLIQNPSPSATKSENPYTPHSIQNYFLQLPI